MESRLALGVKRGAAQKVQSLTKTYLDQYREANIAATQYLYFSNRLITLYQLRQESPDLANELRSYDQNLLPEIANDLSLLAKIEAMAIETYYEKD